MNTMKFIKYILITAATAALIIAFTSCQKETEIQSEYKGTTYFRVEGVNKSGESDYSNIEAIEIK